MRKVWVVALREYVATVRTKTFLVTLFLLPALMGLGAVAQAVMLFVIGPDLQPQLYAVIDRTPGGKVIDVIEAAATKRNQGELVDPRTGRQREPAYVIERVAPSAADDDAIARQRHELSQRVTGGDLVGFVDVGPDFLKEALVLRSGSPGDDSEPPERATLRYQSNRPPSFGGFPAWLRDVVREGVERERCAQLGLAWDQFKAVRREVPFTSVGLTRHDPQTGGFTEGSLISRAIPSTVAGVLSLFLLMVIFLGANALLQGVVEEKMQRVAEVLLGSVSPFDLMLGKLVGTTCVCLTLAAVYLGLAYGLVLLAGVAGEIPGTLLAWYAVFQVLALLMYGSVFLAVGAACTDMKDSQTLLIPAVVFTMIPVFPLPHVLENPGSMFSTLVSFFPPATPMLMIVRLALPPGVPWWQPPLGAVLVLATTVLCVYAAGRVFRVGILFQGKNPTPADLARWLLRG